MEYPEQREQIIKKYKALRDEGLADIKYNKSDLGKSFDTTEKIMKWLAHRAQWLQLHHSFEYNRMRAWKKSYEYYKTDYQFTLNTKEEYNIMINTDPSYSEPADLATLTSQIIDYIDDTIANLKSRQFEIKNYIEWRRFQAGLS